MGTTDKSMGPYYTVGILHHYTSNQTRRDSIMNPDDITLDTMGKQFAYEKVSRDIESITDLDALKNIAKSFAKLYYKQQEVVAKLGI